MVTPASGANPDSWLTLNGFPLSFQEQSENQQAGIKDFDYHYNKIKATPTAPDRLVVSIEGEDKPLDMTAPGLWEWRPRSYAGVYHLQAKAPGYPLYTAKVRVFPTQISQERYDRMLEEISRIAVDLLFSLHSPAGAKVKTEERSYQSSALREYNLLQPIILQLKQIMAGVSRNPYGGLAKISETRLLFEINHFSAVQPLGGPAIRLPKQQVRTGIDLLPLNWSVQQEYLTYDVFENRLLKHFLLRQVPRRLKFIQTSAQYELGRRKLSLQNKLANEWEDDETPNIKRLEEIIRDCAKQGQQLKSWGNQPFFKPIGEFGLDSRPTQVLQKHPFYSRFYKLYLQFQRELRLSLDTDKYLADLALRKLSELYEMWAVFHLTDIIMDTLEDYDYEIISQDLFYRVEEDRFQFQVRKDIASIVMARNDIQVKFRYEPIYPKLEGNRTGLVSVDYQILTPDFAVEIWSQNQPRAVVIFDAKYKTEEKNGMRFYLDVDLDKMRKYRDLIRYQNPRRPTYQGRPPKIVSSAYIIYPGEVLSHDQYEPEIGALPLITKMDKTKKDQVLNAIEDILEKAGNFGNLKVF